MIAWPLVAAVLSLATRANMLGSTLLFLGIPCVMLTLWEPRRAVKAFLFSLIWIPVGIFIDHFIYATHQWYVVSAFSYRLFGIIALEEMPWFFLSVYYIVMYWEHFVERRVRERNWRTRTTYLAAIAVLLALGSTAAWAWFPGLLHVPYFYLVMAVFFVGIPLLLMVTAHPQLGQKFFGVGLYFAYAAFVYELVALALGQWTFPSTQFIGWVEIRGLRFPLEEFAMWMLMSGAGMLAYYEFFDDDRR